MCCKNLWKKSIPFFLAFCLGILCANLFSVNEIPLNLLKEKVAPPVENKISENIKENSGSAACNSRPDKFIAKKETDVQNTKIKFISKPQPHYTEDAKRNSVEGKVLLRITFLANGEIGTITPVKELPDGLTEQAIEAAKKIKFKPRLRNGKPVTVTMSVQYTFTIY